MALALGVRDLRAGSRTVVIALVDHDGHRLAEIQRVQRHVRELAGLIGYRRIALLDSGVWLGNAAECGNSSLGNRHT
jgi:hypothetical protein